MRLVRLEPSQRPKVKACSWISCEGPEADEGLTPEIWGLPTLLHHNCHPGKKKKYKYVHTHTLMQESWLLTNDKRQLFSGNLRISSVSTERAVPAQPHPTRSGAKRPITTKWIRLISPIYNVQCPIQTLIFEIKEKQKAVYVHWWCKITKIYLTFASLQKRWCLWGQWSYSCFASASMLVLFLLLFFFYLLYLFS